MKKGIGLALLIVFVLGLTGIAYAENGKIGFVDRRTIAFEYNKIKDLNASIEQDYEAARQEIEIKTADIKKLSEDMELLSESARQEKEPELQEKIRDFDNYRREKMQELGKKRDDGMMEITKEIDLVCKEYGKKNGYFTILDKAAALYSPDTADITQDVLAELNK
ncbi:MAG: OmpH family outer membrane protein [Candidatus Omnitrophica bacterium]|nr:OmpH family outer membrane protein [Candidatus Omnitrophota bacterium]